MCLLKVCIRGGKTCQEVNCIMSSFTECLLDNVVQVPTLLNFKMNRECQWALTRDFTQEIIMNE